MRIASRGPGFSCLLQARLSQTPLLKPENTPLKPNGCACSGTQIKVGMTKRLPEKRRRFVEAYMGEAAGNASEAARIAGYKCPGPEGFRLLQYAEIQAAIDSRVESDPSIMTRQERQKFWSEAARGNIDDFNSDGEAINAALSTRLKASELLARSQADFVERVKIERDDPREDLAQLMGLIVAKPTRGQDAVNKSDIN